MATSRSQALPPNGYWHRAPGGGAGPGGGGGAGPEGRGGGIVSIGSVRVRLTPSPQKVARSGGGEGQDCCCGVPWPRAGPSRPHANNSRAQAAAPTVSPLPTPVYRSSLQWTQHTSASGLGDVKCPRSRPPEWSSSANGGTLERLQRFRLGGGSERGARGGPAGSAAKKSGGAHKKKPRSSDKAERLRELTEKLKLPSSKQVAATDASAVPVQDVFECVRVPKPEPVMSTTYTQRTIPFRSASFTQMDYSPEPSTSETSPQSKLSLIPQATARLLGRRFGSQSFESSIDEPEESCSKDLPPQPPKRNKHRVPKVDHCTQTVDEEPNQATAIAPKSKIRPPAQLNKQLSLNSNLEKLDTFLNELIGIKMEYEDKYARPADKSKKARSIGNISALVDNKLGKIRKSDGDSNNNVSFPKSDVTSNNNGSNPTSSSNNNNDTKASSNYSYDDTSDDFASSNVSGVDLSFCGNDTINKISESASTASENKVRCDTDSESASRNQSMDEEIKLPAILGVTGASSVSFDVPPESIVSKWSFSKSESIPESPDEIKTVCLEVKNDSLEKKDSASFDSGRSESKSLESSRSPSGEDNDSGKPISRTDTIPSQVTVYVTYEKDDSISDAPKTNDSTDLSVSITEPGSQPLLSDSSFRDSLKLSKDSSLESNSNLSDIHCPKTPETKYELRDVASLEANPAAKEELLSRLQLLSEPDKRRPKLVAQSSEERDDDGVMFRSPKRFVLTRADSLSEGESDAGDRRPVTPASDRDSTASPSLLDHPDHEQKKHHPHHHHNHHHNHHHHHPPKMYEKRPLRGPYGQMLEAEMKRPESTTEKLHKLHSSEDLKFLIKECLKFPPSGTSKLRAVDDCHLRRSHTSPGEQAHRDRASPKRKVSANIPFSQSSLAPSAAEGGFVVHHQRTTSSPSQLEGCSAAPSQQLLAQLLKGSSERGCTTLPSPVFPANNLVQKDTRTHVVEELLETEKSYVDSLQTLINKYLKPLKEAENSVKLDADIVDEIFFQVPEILAHHLEFLEALEDRLKNWNMKQKIIIGDILLETFSKQSVIESYTAFIKNWKSARETIKSTCQSEPAFARFLETMAREHKGKLALDSLFIMPVQRIPRYELLIQTLLKHTEESHPDFSTLLEAQKAVHALAVHINCMERDSLELEQIERLIEGLGHLVAADRTFLRHDLVTMAVSAQSLGRKERALFLFSDLLVITSIKRKSGTARKMATTSPESVTSSFEANKYKLLTKIPLENIEVVKIKDKSLRRMLWEIENLTKDISTLSQMSNLVSTLHCSHLQLESSIRDMLSALNKQLADRQASDSQLSYLELILHTRNGSENVSIAFSKPEERASWEGTFNEAKQRLSVSAEKKSTPEFVIPLQIRKTRAGLQFTCAAPSACQKDVWVCNSDGYIGQVCRLSLYPKPTVSQCIPVHSARILCITAVPAISKNREEDQGNRGSTSVSISVEDIDQGGNIHLDSSSSSEGEDEKEKDKERTDSDAKQLPMGVRQISQDNDKESTMWLGTEDGCILIYKCIESCRTRENCVEIKHGSAVYSIVYFHDKVFVSLANGNVCVYSRDQNNAWNTSEPTSILSIGSAVAPVTRMCPVLDKLWCSSHSSIHIVEPSSLKIVHKFSVSGDTNRAVTCFVVAGLGVWLSLHNSANMRLIHAASYETLAEVNIAPAVTKMLDSCDDIIRQHKAACLRVTSLLAHKELLWIGTSAGVLLTMPLPTITQSTTRLNSVPVASGAPHGHTGHVRFLTMVEKAPKEGDGRPKDDKSSNEILVISGGDGYEDFRSTNIAEVAGREDSTNHLLLWRM
ncbi:uncharacterized protein [Bemisia tabaci]|uniref:uncharacterized protein n=1 Tax=Bemisia tabaci TaxID=7038 RepID=UPI003B288E07